MDLNKIEKVARQMFKGNNSAVKNAQLSDNARRAMQQWNTAQVQPGAVATTAKIETLGGWL